jgi:hypothetical protein
MSTRRCALTLACALVSLSGCQRAEQRPAPASTSASAAVGLPVYPGAVELRQSATGGGRQASAVLVSRDPVEKVYRYYKARLGGPFTIDKLVAGGDANATLTMSKDQVLRTVAIRRSGERSEIMLLRINLLVKREGKP